MIPFLRPCKLAHKAICSKVLKGMKPSTRQRFISLNFGYPSEELEAEIVSRETGAAPNVSKRLVQIARKIRNLTELSVVESVSTRLLVAAGTLIHAGVPPRLACVTAIAEPLTDDPDARDAIRQVIEVSI